MEEAKAKEGDGDSQTNFPTSQLSLQLAQKEKKIFCISHQHIFGILVLILVSSVCVDIRVRAPSLILLAMWGPLNQTVEVSNSVLSRPKQMLHI